MKKSILLFISAVLCSACLKNDILDKDLQGTNFQQSDFYMSGDFVSNFNLEVLDIQVTTIQNSQVGDLCRYTYTARLEPAYAAELKKNWGDEIQLVYRKLGGNPYDYVDFPLGTNYTQTFTFTTYLGDCNSSTKKADMRLELLTPESERVSAAIDYKTLNLPTSL